MHMDYSQLMTEATPTLNTSIMVPALAPVCPDTVVSVPVGKIQRKLGRTGRHRRINSGRAATLGTASVDVNVLEPGILSIGNSQVGGNMGHCIVEAMGITLLYEGFEEEGGRWKERGLDHLASKC